jgi:hypothetical protein
LSARPRAADTAPTLPGPGLAERAASALEWRRLADQATAEAVLAAAPVLDAARLAYIARGADVGTWACGPALIVWRESYACLPDGHEVPALLTERAWKIGRAPDWRAAEAAAGAAWPAVAAALGVAPEVRPAKGSLRALLRAGEEAQARAVLSALAAPQLRRAT